MLLAAAVGALAAIGLLPAPAQAASATPAPNIASLHLGSAATLPNALLAGRGTASVCAKYGHCVAKILTVGPHSSKPLTTAVPAGYGPADFAKAYGLPAGAGGKGTIAILDEGAFPTLESTLNAYRKTYGLPACTSASGCFKQVGEHGGAPLPAGTTDDEKSFDEGVGIETTLDVDMASSACPMCKILEITVNRDMTATNDVAAEDFGVALDTAAKLGANAASISYQFAPDATLDLGQAARDFFHPGMAITVSSGDGGYEGSPDGWPQNLPTVTSVGGTSLYSTPGTARGYTEVAWAGAGSGCAGDLPAALGQPSAVSAFCGGHRTDSDISADADPNTGAAVYDDYAPETGQPYDWVVVGGTSESSPFIAGVYARAGHLAEVEGPSTLYADPAKDFNDVQIGANYPPHAGCDNALCVSGPGWDGPTGLGTPNGLAGF
ncbi:MAG TPA: peptidase S8 [Actinospica sp.]|nr:peptidase S8 [Actinospica sp.]